VQMGADGWNWHKIPVLRGGTAACYAPHELHRKPCPNASDRSKSAPKPPRQRKNCARTAERTQNALNNRPFFRMVEHVERFFYSTGQVASQLGVTLATVRLLCENGVIEAETTPGGQWRVPASEVERLKRDGLPLIPRPLPVETGPPETTADQAPDTPGKPSEAVLSAQDLVAITRSTLEKRRIDREIEETEDWFRERLRQQAGAAELERQRAEAKIAEDRRRLWIQRWTKYALDSVQRCTGPR
jgi:excisionase family DNA binding protein